jgi:5-carboxymethyl-2-hydroxymuconic-semialdehyde dehydrogenase
MLASWRVAPALAAGHAVVFKPPEWAPLSAPIFAEAMDEAGVAPGVFNIVHGHGDSAGAALAEHPAVTAIAFTGSGATAAKIMSAGAPALKRHSFELGGKSPVVIFRDADIDRAVDAAVFGVFSLNGERCTAGSRLLIDEAVYDDVVEAVASRASAIRIGDPFDPATELGPLIHPDHLRRVEGYIGDGAVEGRIVAGGGLPRTIASGNYVEATVIADVRRYARVFQEEIFGPVVTLTPFSGDDEAIELANATRYGLAAYVWTNDVSRAHRVGQAIDSGLVWVNSQNVRDLRTPFGGLKQSGNRYEGGHWSFDFYCDLHTIHIALADHRIPRFGADDRDEAVVRASDTTR